MTRDMIESQPLLAPSAAHSDWPGHVQAFREAMLAVLTSSMARSSPPEVAAECAEMALLLSEVAAPIRDPQPKSLPGVRFLLPALDNVPPGPLRALGASVAAVAEGLHWRNKYSDSDQKLYDRFGFCDLIGPDGVQDSDQVSLGLVIVGPQTLYPLHAHPARELYLVLSGTADWAVDDACYAPRPPGTFMLHREMQPHAMQTGPDTMLALSMWRGDIRSPSRFTGPRP